MPIELANTIDFKRVLITFNNYLNAMNGAWPLMVSIFLGILAAAILYRFIHLRKRAPRIDRVVRSIFPWGVLAASLAAAIHYAVTKAFLCDDAYISLTYARNLAEGNGLVFNIGERVEGYTNFLWTVLLAALIFITRLEPPFIAVVLPIIMFAANLGVVYLIGRRLSKRFGYDVHLPIAVALMSVHGILTNYATSGLETSMASLLVDLGIFFLLGAASPKRSFLSGSMFVLAALTRPDHGIFYAAAGLAEFYQCMVAMARTRREGRKVSLTLFKNMASFSLPFLLYVAHLIWRYRYYGEWVPNTYYAKSANLSYIAQGFLYAERFYLETHFFIPLFFFFVWLAWPFRSDRVARLKVFALVSMIVYHFYILKIGGCFMNGRFFVSLVPIALIPVEMLVHRLIGQSGRFGRLRHVFGVFIIATMGMGAFWVVIPGGKTGGMDSYGFINDEYIPCKLIRWYPVKVAHFSWRQGLRMNELWTQRGLRPTIATHGIGMIAYYSRLKTIDMLGLTDKVVARLPIEFRGAPGHEKMAKFEYLLERGAVIRRGGPYRAPPHFRNIPVINWGHDYDPGWRIAKYDRKWIKQFRRVSPEMKFWDFEWFLDHRYMGNMHELPSERLLADLSWFEEYYFFHNDDYRRYDRFLDLLEAFSLPECTMPSSEPVCRQPKTKDELSKR